MPTKHLKRLNDVSLRVKLLGSFGAILFLLSAIVVSTLLTNRSSAATIDELIHEDYPSEEAARGIVTAVRAADD